MKFENYIYSEIKGSPSIYKDIDFESSKQYVLDYVFLVWGNGMKVEDIKNALDTPDESVEILDQSYFDNEIIIEKTFTMDSLSAESFHLSEVYYNLLKDWKLKSNSATTLLDNRWIKSYENFIEYYKIQPGYNEITEREYYKKEWEDWLFYKTPLSSMPILNRGLPNWKGKQYYWLHTGCLLEKTILSWIELPQDWIDGLFEFYSKIKPIAIKEVLEWKKNECQYNWVINSANNIDKYFKEKWKVVQYEKMDEEWQELLEKSKSFKASNIGKIK